MSSPIWIIIQRLSKTKWFFLPYQQYVNLELGNPSDSRYTGRQRRVQWLLCRFPWDSIAMLICTQNFKITRGLHFRIFWKEILSATCIGPWVDWQSIRQFTISWARPLCQVWVEFSGKREESAPLLGAECPGSTLVPVCLQGKAERGRFCGTPEDRLFSLDRHRGFGGEQGHCSQARLSPSHPQQGLGLVT